MSSSKKQSKVFVAIPAGDAYVHARLVQSLIPQLGDNPFLIVAGVSPVAHARNEIVRQFLTTDAEYLFMMDADTIPPGDALEKLLSVDADIATGITPILRQGSVTSNIYMDESGMPIPLEEAKKEAPYEVRAVGASCILIKRAVIEKIGDPWFAEIWGDDGRFCSEDITFCNFAKDNDFTVTCVPEVVCKHSRTIVI